MLALLIVVAPIQAQETSKKEKKSKYNTESFWVNSDCDMCKTRIESACDIKGVRSVLYDKDAFLLTVSYRPQILSLEEIHEAIARVGYDTSLRKASDEAYQNLPDCCQYDRKKQK